MMADINGDTAIPRFQSGTDFQAKIQSTYQSKARRQTPKEVYFKNFNFIAIYNSIFVGKVIYK